MSFGRAIGGGPAMRLIAVILIGVLVASFTVCRGRIALPSGHPAIGRTTDTGETAALPPGCASVAAPAVVREAVALPTVDRVATASARPSDDPDPDGVDLSRIERPPNLGRAV